MDLHANLSGTWVLDLAASTFGFLPPPLSRVDEIAFQADEVVIRTRQSDLNGDNEVERRLTLGAPFAPVQILGRMRQIRAWVADNNLMVETLSEVSQNQRRILDRWRRDGEWLVVERTLEQPGGAVRQVLRFRPPAG